MKRLVLAIAAMWLVGACAPPPYGATPAPSGTIVCITTPCP